MHVTENYLSFIVPKKLSLMRIMYVSIQINHFLAEPSIVLLGQKSHITIPPPYEAQQKDLLLK